MPSKYIASIPLTHHYLARISSADNNDCATEDSVSDQSSELDSTPDGVIFGILLLSLPPSSDWTELATRAYVCRALVVALVCGTLDIGKLLNGFSIIYFFSFHLISLCYTVIRQLDG